MLPKKTLLSMAGAVAAIASTVVVVDYINRKVVRQKPYGAQLVAGILGLAAGTALTVFAQMKMQDETNVIVDVLTDEDIAMMDENISEVLGTSAEHTEKPEQLRKIEVDEDATIEDFM